MGGNSAQMDIEYLNTSDPILVWQTVDPGLAQNVQSARAVEYGDEIFTIGGKTFGDTPTAVNYVQVTSIETLETQLLSTLPLTNAVYDIATIVYQGVIYSFGGETDADTYLDS